MGVSRIPCRIFFVGGLKLFKANTYDLPVSVTLVHLSLPYFPFFLLGFCLCWFVFCFLFFFFPLLFLICKCFKDSVPELYAFVSVCVIRLHSVPPLKKNNKVLLHFFSLKKIHALNKIQRHTLSPLVQNEQKGFFLLENLFLIKQTSLSLNKE